MEKRRKKHSALRAVKAIFYTGALAAVAVAAYAAGRSANLKVESPSPYKDSIDPGGENVLLRPGIVEKIVEQGECPKSGDAEERGSADSVTASRHQEYAKEVQASVHHSRRSRKRKQRRQPRAIAMLLLWAVLLSAVTGCAMVGVVQTQGDSMEPGMAQGELLLYARTGSGFEFGDIAVFQREGVKYVKRVIGLPGDWIDLTADGTVLINGKAKPMGNVYLLGETMPRDVSFPLVVPEKSYFVMGDNRTVSLDSRNEAMGYVGQWEMSGKVICMLAFQ